MALASMFIGVNKLKADLNSVNITILLGRHKLDAAVAVLVAIPDSSKDTQRQASSLLLNGRLV